MSTPLVVGIVLAVLFVAGYAAWKRREQSALHGLLEEQAARRGGVVEPGTLLYYPKLVFPHGGVEITASALLGSGELPDRAAATTYVSFPIEVPAGKGFRIDRKKRSVQSAADERFAGDKVETKNPAFDEAYLVRSRDMPTVMHFLDAETQGKLLALAEAGATVDLRLEKKLFIVTVDEIVEAASTLDALVDLTLHAHDALGYLAASADASRRDRHQGTRTATTEARSR